MRIGIGGKFNNQRGIALIVLVLFGWIVLMVASAEILIVSSTQIVDLNVRAAKSAARNLAISNTSLVRSDMDKAIYGAIQQELKSHLEDYAKTEAGNIFRATPLTLQQSIRDPEELLDLLTQSSGEGGWIAGRPIDELSIIKPEGLGKKQEQELMKSLEWREIERKTANSFNYRLKQVFVAMEVLEEPSGAEAAGERAVRIDRYRWLVRAEIETFTTSKNRQKNVTYEDIMFPLSVHFDVVTTVTTSVSRTNDPASGCDSPTREPVDSGFDLFQDKSITVCADDPNLSPRDPLCNGGPKTYSAQFDEADYNKYCVKEVNGNIRDICEERARGESSSDSCPNRNGIVGSNGLCTNASEIAPKGEFKATYAKKTYTSSGCIAKSTPRTTQPGGGIGPRITPPGGGIGPRQLPGSGSTGNYESYRYSWTTAIRIVGIGTNYD